MNFLINSIKIQSRKVQLSQIKHNIADTLSPMCPASYGIEHTDHFLLLCHSFNDNRRSLLAGVIKVFKAVGNIVGLNANTGRQDIRSKCYWKEKTCFWASFLS